MLQLLKSGDQFIKVFEVQALCCPVERPPIRETVFMARRIDLVYKASFSLRGDKATPDICRVMPKRLRQ